MCRSLSQRLGLLFPTVTGIRGEPVRVYDACDGVLVYEFHGDLLFSGADRYCARSSGNATTSTWESWSCPDRRINDAARGLLSGMRAMLRAAGKEGFLVDPDNTVVRPASQEDYDAVVFNTLDDAIGAAQEFRWGEPTSEALVDAARELAGRVLAEDPERLAHSAAVAGRARELAATVPRAAVDTLVAAAWLHDIGYAPQLRETGFDCSTGRITSVGRAGPRRCAPWWHIIRVAGSSRAFTGSTKSCASLNSSRTRLGCADGGGQHRRAQREHHDGGRTVTRQADAPRTDSPSARANPERDDYIRAAAGRVAHRLAVVGSTGQDSDG